MAIPLTANAAITGPLARAVARGKHIFLHDTFGGKGMTCASCHSDAGMGLTQVPGRDTKLPSLANAAAVFPRYKRREHKVITLEDQIQGCIRGALHGQPPAYASATMRDLTAYVTSLAQGDMINMGGQYH